MNVLYEQLQGGSYIQVSKPLARKLGLDVAGYLSEMYARYSYFLGRNMLDPKGGFFVSPKILEQEIGLPKKTQYRLASKLVELGLMTKKKKKVKGAMRRSYYYLNHKAVKKIIILSMEEQQKLVEERNGENEDFALVIDGEGNHGTQNDPVDNLVDSGVANDPDGVADDPVTGPETTPRGTQDDPVYNNNKNDTKTNDLKTNNLQVAELEIKKITVADIPIQVEGMETKITRAGKIKFWPVVRFTLEAFLKLVEGYDVDILESVISELCYYQKNKKYKDYYLTTLSRIRKKTPTAKRTKEGEECYRIIEQFNNGLVDGDVLDNSTYCEKIITKLNQHTGVKSSEYTRQEVLTGILWLAKANKYVIRKISNPKSIFNNLAELANTAGSDVQEQNQFSY